MRPKLVNFTKVLDISLILVLLIPSIFLFTENTQAREEEGAGYDTIGDPSNFNDSCPNLSDCDDVRIDFNCQKKQILDPRADCCIEYCADDGQQAPTSQENIVNFNFFGVQIQLNSNQAIAQLIFLGFNIFLGIVALVAVVVGVIAAVQRANADSEDEISSTTKRMRNAIIGVLIVGLSLLIVQLVSSLLGLGSITEIVNFTQFLPGASDGL